VNADIQIWTSKKWLPSNRFTRESGFRIKRDYESRWFFERPDELAVPSCGYQAQDMIDDEIDNDIGELSELINYPSAEGLLAAAKTFSDNATLP